MPRNRDTQRQAVYKWETGLILSGRELTLDQCREIVAQVFADYAPQYKPPKVKDGRGRRHACGSLSRVCLPRHSRRPAVVLHETAHALQCVARIWPGHVTPSKNAWHGPEFATLYMELLRRYLGVDRAEMRAAGIAQRPRRVRFAALKDVPQPVGRTRRLSA